MPLEHVRGNDESLTADAARLVNKALAAHGVPVTVGQVEQLVDILYPRIIRMRRASWQGHVVELGRQAAAAGVEIKPEPIRPYPRKALFDAIAEVSRLSPDSSKLHVMMLDEESRRRVMQPVTPDFSNRGDTAVKARVASELGRRVGRHVVDAGRSAVSDSAHNGSARFKSGRPARVGYARVLSGRESCAFCAMLASRGPVYSKDTVVRRRDGRRYHDGCDCIPVLVVDGEPWEGQAEAEALYSRWRELTWENGRIAPNQFKKWQQAVSAGQLDPKLYSPLKEQSSGWKSLITFNGVKPKQHEMVTYEFLAQKGHRIELNPVSAKEKVKSPDAWIDGVLTEIKAPLGRGPETVYQLVRKGSKQSENMIIDLHRTELTLDEAIAQVDRAQARYDRVQEVIIISQDNKVVRRKRG